MHLAVASASSPFILKKYRDPTNIVATLQLNRPITSMIASVRGSRSKHHARVWGFSSHTWTYGGEHRWLGGESGGAAESSDGEERPRIGDRRRGDVAHRAAENEDKCHRP
jgi:hypothetical protein